ncbi:MAG: SCO family protein [Deltaproteobacteria bacterium]|nr:SCO family protein [Deltaproteobacteria bacterium]
MVAYIFIQAPLIFSAEPIPIELKDVGIEEHLGTQISLDRSFLNEENKKVFLKDFFHQKRPIVLTLVYYRCPNLCHFLLDGFTEVLKKLSWTAGTEFDIVTISIDPTETAALSLEKKKHRLEVYGRNQAEKGWHFLTGEESAIQALAREVGFQYRYDPDQKQYAHAAGIFILTPEGKISRYLYGISFRPLDLKLALLEAAQGKIGNVVDKFLLFCYHYDPKGRKYSIFARNLMSFAGLITVCLVIIMLIVLSKKKMWFR